MTLRFRVALATAAAAALTGGLLAATAGQASALAKGDFADFNNDGYADVAYSAGNAYVNGREGAGQIVVQYGSANGLTTTTKRQTFSQDSAGVAGTAEKHDGFGWSSAIGDFNADGYDDLAVGASRETLGTDVTAGVVHLFFGSPTGLKGGAALVDPAPSSHDAWGQALAAGDFDGDGRDDLAVGSDHAKTWIFKGGTTSSTTFAGRSTVSPPIHSGTVDGRPLGALTIHAGDVTGDQRDDLVIDGFDANNDGWNANYYFQGSATGLTGSYQQLTSGIMTGIADINGDTYGDIVTGIEWDSSGTPDSSDGGKVVVRYGSPSGPQGSQTVSQNSGNVPGGSEAGDAFGGEVSLGDINNDGMADLAIGAWGENLTNSSGTSIANSGSVTVLYGSASGLNTSTGMQFFQQDTTGVPSVGEKDDNFGSEVKLADVTGDGQADLTIGSIGENDFNGAMTVLKAANGRIGVTGAVLFGPSAVGVSTTGYPVYGGNAAN
ncbi:FG-GAP repeat protein [Streptomyces polyrhachis]|uniref:FG-GAP repeat protein n=1 Tax=Streptomyces polyrhachis TaxID=1282885 RepID=A0ABW2GCI2_9ACTN